MKQIRLALCLVVTVLALAACASLEPMDPEPRDAEQRRDSADTREGSRSAVTPLPPAAQALQDQADAASAEGEHDRAAALLERALGIAPDHPVLWHNLAVVHYRKGDYRQAESMARRSADHGADIPALVRRNWELIVASRESAGDVEGAAAARERLESLPSGGDS